MYYSDRIYREMKGAVMKKLHALAAATLMLCIILTSCNSPSKGGEKYGTPSTPTDNTSAADNFTNVEIAPVEYDDDDLDFAWSESGTNSVLLTSNSMTFTGTGAKISGTELTISKGGTYVIKGKIDDGRIVVAADKDKDKVRLILDGADITCKTSSAIYVKSADKVIITLAAGTQNYLTDGEKYNFANAADTEPDAALFSADDLTVNGEGTLTINAKYNDAIKCKDDLKITGGNIIIKSVDDGITGKDSVSVKDAVISVEAGGDAVKATNAEDGAKGFVSIESGVFTLVAGTDGIQAETAVLITGGVFNIKTGGGSVNSSSGTKEGAGAPPSPWGQWGGGTKTTDTASAKAIKGAKEVNITGGTFVIDSSDDSIHSNGNVNIAGGAFDISSGDDGMHADTTLTVSNAQIDIKKSYEGLESTTINVNSGNIHIKASDDGLNAAGGNDGSAMGGRPGQGGFSAGSGMINLRGGYLYVNADGDGLDANGSITMSGGTVIVCGPTNSGNGSLDYDGTFTKTGGTLIAAGSAGMAQSISSSSTSCAIMITFTSAQKAGTIIRITDGSGKDVATFAPEKTYQSVIISTPDIIKGGKYTISYAGACTGSATDGLYSGGEYTGGTELSSVTVSSYSTNVGKTISPGGGGGGGGMGRP